MASPLPQPVRPHKADQQRQITAEVRYIRLALSCNGRHRKIGEWRSAKMAAFADCPVALAVASEKAANFAPLGDFFLPLPAPGTPPWCPLRALPRRWPLQHFGFRSAGLFCPGAK
jgi:hypothetical protein